MSQTVLSQGHWEFPSINSKDSQLADLLRKQSNMEKSQNHRQAKQKNARMSNLTSCNNNNPFNSPLSRKTQVNQYHKTSTHSLTPYLCGYYTTSLINFLRSLQLISSSLHICRLSQSFHTTSLQVFSGLPLGLTSSKAETKNLQLLMKYNLLLKTR